MTTYTLPSACGYLNANGKVEPIIVIGTARVDHHSSVLSWIISGG